MTCLLQKSSHLTELRREISGLSQLASDFYAASQQSEADRVSLDRSEHVWGGNLYLLISIHITDFDHLDF